jgi:hypothetical protein
MRDERMQKKIVIDRTPILVAIIAAVPILVGAYWQFVWKPSYSTTQQIKYVGRVIDSKTNAALSGVKVSLEFQDGPRIVQTDSEGIFRFTVKSTGNELAGCVRVEYAGYQIYDRNIQLTPDNSNLEDIRLIPMIPTSSDSKDSSTKQLSSQVTPNNTGVNECDSIPFELTVGKLIRLKLINGRILTGLIQPFEDYLSKGLIPLLSYDNLTKLQGRFGDQKRFSVPIQEANEFIDWINVSHVHSCQIVETTVDHGIHFLTRGGKKIEGIDGFTIQVGIGNMPGRVKIKYRLSDIEKSFDFEELEIRNGAISLPATLVFISYAPENRKEAISISKSLQNYGILTRLDEDIILAGDHEQLKIEQAIEKADFFLPLLSCQYHNKELHHALHRQSSLPEDKRYIIPILLDECDPPYNIKKFKSMKITDEDWLKKLLKSMAPIPYSGS